MPANSATATCHLCLQGCTFGAAQRAVALDRFDAWDEGLELREQRVGEEIHIEMRSKRLGGEWVPHLKVARTALAMAQEGDPGFGLFTYGPYHWLEGQLLGAYVGRVALRQRDLPAGHTVAGLYVLSTMVTTPWGDVCVYIDGNQPMQDSASQVELLRSLALPTMMRDAEPPGPVIDSSIFQYPGAHVHRANSVRGSAAPNASVTPELMMEVVQDLLAEGLEVLWDYGSSYWKRPHVRR